ncbi:MAG: NADH-quinone oxidoreductase subunit NuoF [Actinobacteria bacterium]|nr:NADH-quinone oxidoreductase subunit NuoF [Actinomycetota bacterium]
MGTCGIASGAEEIRRMVEDEIESRNITYVIYTTSGCVGFCSREPMLTVEGYDSEPVIYHSLDEKKVRKIFDKHIIRGKIAHDIEPITSTSSLFDFYKYQESRVLHNRGKINPFKIEDYIAREGYEGFIRALEYSPDEIIRIVSESGLRGRGGAGFPTGKKWEFCKKAKSPDGVKYVVCNGDEGDPGAFMDRNLLESDPHSVLEGMLICALAIGANKGYAYIRAEYPLAVKTFENAIEQAREYGLLGENILGSGFSFDVEIYQGAGAFVCGEETALLRSIEGKRGMPRPRPPFPANEGLYGMPTVINNVETLSNIPQIILNGPQWFSSIGTETSKGTKIFALTGAVNNVGLVEVPMGMPLYDIVYKVGGGIRGGKKFKAVQIGGPSGGCIPEKYLNVPVDYEKIKELGAIMGSGGMIVIDEDTCMVDLARYFMDFIQDESCGQCTPCRIGTRRMLEILERITEGEGREGDVEKLEELGRMVKEASLCGLGKTAPNPVLSTIQYFREEYKLHIEKKRCSAVTCKEIISSPCQHVCPIDTKVPVYISFIARKSFKEAFDIILEDNPLPSVCGRVCHHPCEYKCQAGKWGSPIAIRALKRFVTDWAINNKLYPETKREQGAAYEEVAIIGSGPAGLTAGYYLARKGYDVTIFEALKVPGGALSVCIPEYRLPKSLLKLDIENIKSAGVKIITNTWVGRDISFEEILGNFRAVFIATGANKSRKLNIPNEEAQGVVSSMEFLKKVNLGENVNIGKRVGVIGGGNSAIDAARVANRIRGCEKVFLLYRRTRSEMPAFEEEIEALLEEGIEIRFLTAPTRVIAHNRRVTGVECIVMKLGEADESGRRKPIPIPGSEFCINLDMLIVAIGEEPDLSFLNESNMIKISTRGTIVVDKETLATNLPGVFAGGDVVTGPNTVVDAISSGKVAAEMIDKYLRGMSLIREYKLTRPPIYLPPVELIGQEMVTDRQLAPKLPPAKRIKNFEEVDLTMSEEVAVKEASRCLRCDLETKDGKKAIRV